MDTGHWIGVAGLGLPPVGWCVLKVCKLFLRVGHLEGVVAANSAAHERNIKDHQNIIRRNDADHQKIKAGVDTSLIALRELLVHEGLRAPGSGINGETVLPPDDGSTEGGSD